MFKAAASRSGSGRAVWEDVLGKLFAGSSRTASSTARFSSRAVAPRFTMPSGGAPRFTAARQSVLRGRQQQQRGFRTSQFRASDKHQRLSMGQRLKKLSKDYGKAAVAVYFLLSAIDLPLFFLLVQMAGTERIGGHTQPLGRSRDQKLVQRLT